MDGCLKSEYLDLRDRPSGGAVGREEAWVPVEGALPFCGVSPSVPQILRLDLPFSSLSKWVL